MRRKLEDSKTQACDGDLSREDVYFSSSLELASSLQAYIPIKYQQQYELSLNGVST